MNKITFETKEDEILKEELTRDIDLSMICVESEGKPIPTYKKLAGLTNLGKTYFINFGEVKKVHEWAQTQMTNKYGSELYGINAQLSQQRADGTGNIQEGKSSLITCNVSTLFKLPEKGFVKEANYDEQLSFDKTIKRFDEYLMSQKWDKDHKSDYNEFVRIEDEFNYNLDADSEVNKKAWGNFLKMLKKEPWKSNLVKGNKLYDHFKNLNLAYSQWDNGGAARGSKDELYGRAQGDSGTGWTPLVTCKIDVQTKFGEDWYKRKFKSGFLNKMIFAIKTDARSHSSSDHKNDMTNHKYTADEMLPQDKRKLDSLQWKMTNKVANDYISLLLGWSRPKEMYKENDQPTPTAKTPERDEAFGKEMAKKALSNRGLLGRLRQKLFSSGQSNNVISVAFQLADWNDGWTEVDPPEPTEQSESTDNRGLDLARKVCEGTEAVDRLIEHHLIGE